MFEDIYDTKVIDTLQCLSNQSVTNNVVCYWPLGKIIDHSVSIGRVACL